QSDAAAAAPEPAHQGSHSGQDQRGQGQEQQRRHQLRGDGGAGGALHRQNALTAASGGGGHPCGPGGAALEEGRQEPEHSDQGALQKAADGLEDGDQLPSGSQQQGAGGHGQRGQDRRDQQGRK